MPQKLITQNSFQGMVRDNLHSLTDQKTFRMALNAVLSNRDEFGVFTNEESTKLCGGGDGIVGLTYLDERDESLAFKDNGDIILIGPECGNGRFVFNASEFGCDFNFGGCEWHDIETRVEGSDCKETYVYFSSKCEYYWFNLDEMLDPKRKNGLKDRLQDDTCECTRGCDYFKVFQCACAPKINAKSYESGGGSLAAGSYMFVARLINSDGGETNWFHITDPISVGSENNKAGEIGNGHIEVQLSCLDCRYSKIELAVIERIGGVLNTKLIDTFNYNNGQFSYNYTGQAGTPIDISEILVKGKTYIQGKNLTQKDGRMFYYGIKPRKNLNYQYLANQIQTEWVEYEIPVEQACKMQVKSFMRGETYAFGIVFHFKDGTSSPVFHIPSLRGGGTGDANNSFENATAVDINEDNQTITEVGGNNSGSTPQSTGTISITDNGLIEYSRGHKSDSVNYPQNDDYDTILENLIDSYNTTVQDVCQSTSCSEDAEASQCCQCGEGASATSCEDEDGCITVSVPAGEPCPNCGSATQACESDLPTVEDMHSIWQGILADFGVDNLTITEFNPSTIKEVAQSIMESVQRRERREYKTREYSVDRPANSYAPQTQDLLMSNGEDTREGSIRSGNLYDCCGIEETELRPVQIRTWDSIPKIEENQKYPCNKDCNGNPIYGDLAGSDVSHHTTPNACDSPPWVSHSNGVPSAVTPDVDEYSDGYVRPLGVRFSNITIPGLNETSVPLCEQNPYSIVSVKRTDKNKSVLLKGYAFGTYVGNNNNKEYEVPRHGANSPETVNRYLDEGGQFPRLSQGQNGNSHLIFSLDGCTRKPALNADTLVRELEVSGEGFRHGLYARGKNPEDEVHGNRVDQRGTRQAINLNKYSQSGCTEHPIDFKIYAPAHSVVAPPAGAPNRPLLNKAQQEAIWVGSSLEQKQDSSFVGDVLQHSVPINNAEADYVALTRNMPNQYESLVNLSYKPILHAGKNSAGGIIEGLGGDTFIGPYSFVRTSFVSDRVGSCAEGEKFNIPAQVPIKNERRCICDDPNDAIHSLNGQWFWTKLPEDGAEADPKNWAGTHTIINSRTQTWIEAGGNQDVSNRPISDFYYPKTLKTLFTVWGEWEVDPWLRQRGDELNEQVYPKLKSQYSVDSTSDIQGEGGGWRNSLLNQFSCVVRQPSLWSVNKKTFIETLINTIFPALGFGTTLAGIEGALDMTTTIASYPVFAALWYYLKQVLLPNQILDNLLGIPRCKTDDTGGEDDQCIEGWFENFCQYNWDYSCDNDLEVYYGIPDNYYTCDCSECLDENLNNEIYWSDEIGADNNLDPYRTVRPNNHMAITGDHGRLVDLYTQAGGFWAHTTEGYAQLRYGRTAVPSSTGDIILGTGDLLSQPIFYNEGVYEGFAGLKSKTHAINTQYGRFWVDQDACKVYRQNGSSVKEISNRGMTNFLKENLCHCSQTSCKNNHVEGTSGYALGFDPRYNRILITKNDGDPNGSFTLSYDVVRDVWISFHSYTPRKYHWDRKDMYSLGPGGMWQHNVDCSYQTFYGTYYPHILEFTAVPADLKAFTYSYTELHTEAEECAGCHYIEDLDVTFNKIAVYNATESTGTLEVLFRGDNCGDREDQREGIIDYNKSVKFNKVCGEWRFNELSNKVDYSDCKGVPMLIGNTCQPYCDINESIINCEIQGNGLEGKYLTYRLTFDISDKVNLNTISCKTYGTDCQD